MSVYLPPPIKPYYDLIGQALAARGSAPDDYQRDAEYPESVYIVRLCRQLADRIGRPDVTVADVLRADRCASGHTDYQRRLAADCYALACRDRMQESPSEDAGCHLTPGGIAS